MKLWIDDIRPAPEGWVQAYTSDQAISMLAENTFDEVSFDHDLGGDDTSRRVILWICENDIPWPPVVRVHSMNNVGREWLEGMVKRYAPPGTLHYW